MKIAVIGLGRMGLWMAALLSAKGHDVIGFDTNRRQVPGVTSAGGLKQAVAGELGLLINAVPLGQTMEVFRELTPLLRSKTVLVDLCSVKTGLPEFYQNCGLEFCSLHPMFGALPQHAKTLAGENVVVLTAGHKSSREFFIDLFSSMNARVFEYDFQEHDEAMAYALSVPFALSFLFASTLKPETVPGTNFNKHLAITKGILTEDTELLAEIFLNPAVVKELDSMASKFQFLKHVITGRDGEELRGFIESLKKQLAGFEEK